MSTKHFYNILLMLAFHFPNVAVNNLRTFKKQWKTLHQFSPNVMGRLAKRKKAFLQQIFLELRLPNVAKTS